MEMVLIKNGSSEWERMWQKLAEHPLNKGLEEPTVALNPDNGEMWQYMGSYKQGPRTIHEFRHRSHPSDGERRYYKFDASAEMNEADIEKILPVK
jgi:hypothetical protein